MVVYKRFWPTDWRWATGLATFKAGCAWTALSVFAGPGHVPRSRQKKIRQKEVAIRGRGGRQKPNTRVRARDIVDFTIKKTTHEDEYWDGRLLGTGGAADFIRGTWDLLAISKPPRMATHPTGRHLFHCATVFLEQKTGSAVYPLHRLDRENFRGAPLGQKHARGRPNSPPVRAEGSQKGLFFYRF